MARLYADEDFSLKAVRALRALGHDVLTAAEAGRARRMIADADQLAFAISQQRAVVTYNKWHYSRLHGQVRPHFGIVVCTQDRDWQRQAQRVDQAILTCPSLENQYLRVTKT